MYQNLARKDTKSDSRGRSQERGVGAVFPGSRLPGTPGWMETVILLRVIWALALLSALGMQEGWNLLDPESDLGIKQPRVYQRPIRCGLPSPSGQSIHAPRDTSNSAHHAEPRGEESPVGISHICSCSELPYSGAW